MSKNIYTIPNLLSLIRIVLVPFYVVLYLNEAYLHAIILLIISGLSDVVDGFIARKFKQESDIGKILDPLADKITQISLVVCATITYREMALLLFVALFKEVSMILFNFLMLKKKYKAIGAKWYGKLATVCFYIGIGIILLNNIFTFLSQHYIYAIIIIIATTLIFAMIKYYILAKELIKKADNAETDKNTTKEIL